jgi:MFS family permease
MLAFMRRQQRDWVVTVVRTSLDRLAYQMVFPYLSIYIIALGATATQLGLVNSIGMVVAGLAGPFTGWLIDRHGPRTFYLAGIALLAVAYLTYALAQSWGITILAMMAYWMGMSISMHSCATICGNCLANPDRATGMTICETVAAGLLGIVGPIIGTVIVVSSGEVDADAIRRSSWWRSPSPSARSCSSSRSSRGSAGAHAGPVELCSAISARSCARAGTSSAGS